MILTYNFRLRDKHAVELNRQARAVNYVWNYCNETQRRAVEYRRPWLTGFDLCALTAGASKELNLHAHTIQRVCRQYAKSREQQHKPWLIWRGGKSLGWVPFNTGHVSFDGTVFKFRGVEYRSTHLRDMVSGVRIREGTFNRDSRGRWYINCSVEIETAVSASTAGVGIDLGLCNMATLSDGMKIEAPRFYRASEQKMVTAQRCGKAKRVKAIHAKIVNRRKDFLHKVSDQLTRKYGLIVVGDVSPSKLAKTNMAKSVLDAGWSDFRRMLSYKSIRNGGNTLEVSESYTTQTCSTCGTLPASRPRGIAGLDKRVWSCSNCGTVHDRDANAALNILRRGLATLTGGAHAGSSHERPSLLTVDLKFEDV